MQEINRISKLFRDLYNGNPWIDVNIVNTLQQLNAVQASKKILPGSNSIWQIVYHILQWRKNILERLNGNLIPSPHHNYFIEITDQSENEWKKILQELDSSQKKWNGFIESLKDQDLNAKNENDSYSTYEFIMGILQHDAYHLGQVAMLSKWVNNLT